MPGTSIWTLERKPISSRRLPSPLASSELDASLRVLTHIARGEQQFCPAEVELLQECVRNARLAPISFDNAVDSDADVTRIATREGRERTFNAAYSLMHTTNKPTDSQLRLLQRLASRLQIDQHRIARLERMYAEAHNGAGPSHINPIPDPARRDMAVRDHTLRLALASALTGAMTVPVLSAFVETLVISTQVKLIRDMGRFWGFSLDRDSAHAIIVNLLRATGIRLSLHTLVTIIPVLATSSGASSAFVATWVLGRVASQYFARHGDLSDEDMQNVYQLARLEAKDLYERGRVAGRLVA